MRKEKFQIKVEEGGGKKNTQEISGRNFYI